MSERLLRIWYAFRERIGHPKVLTQQQFDAAGTTALLAGSPWIIVNPYDTATAGTTTLTLWRTNVRWDRPPRP